MSDALRVVLDTNVVLSLWHYGHPQMLALRARLDARDAVLLTRADCLAELARVLTFADFALAPARQSALLDDYRARCVVRAAATPAETLAAAALPRCRDPADQMFLELAHAADAHLLLTRDKRLLAMHGRPPWRDRTAIVTPERWWKSG